MRSALIDWFLVHQRKLPWRQQRSAYRTWVSEIMLQQTQVEAVRPYFERFLERFPSIPALAAAPESEVIAHWAGLGYYSRARNLHRAAIIVVEQYGGELPRGVEELAALPGIGRYTAGAISSIAYGEVAPILDGNVMRVLSRLLEIRGDPRSGASNSRLWREATALAAGPNPGALNEALMELGALICIPGTPRCGLCVVSGFCTAFRKGVAAELPERRANVGPEEREHIALVVRGSDNGSSEQFLLRRLPGKAERSTDRSARVSSVWAGLWTFPTDFPGGPQAGTAGAAALAAELGLPQLTAAPLTVIRHGVMNWRITLRVIEMRLPIGQSFQPPPGASWVGRDELDMVALPAPHRRIARLLQAERARLPL